MAMERIKSILCGQFSMAFVPFAIVTEFIVTGHVDNAAPSLKGVSIECYKRISTTHLPGPNEKKICTAASAQTWKICKLLRNQDDPGQREGKSFHLQISQLRPSGRYVEFDAFHCAGQRDAAHE